MAENNEIEFSFLGMKGKANGRYAVTILGGLCAFGILTLSTAILIRWL